MYQEQFAEGDLDFGRNDFELRSHGDYFHLWLVGIAENESDSENRYPPRRTFGDGSNSSSRKTDSVGKVDI